MKVITYNKDKESAVEINRRKKRNFWLKDPSFISKINYEDKDYLKSVFDIIYPFLFKLPIPVLSTWDYVNNKIFISLGKNTIASIFINNNIAPYDYITLIDKYLYNYYPSFKTTYLKQIPYDIDEIVEVMKTSKITFDEVVSKKKLQEYNEIGVIERIYFTEDSTFKLNINNVKQLRLSNIPLTYLLTSLRNIKDNNERKDYILSNSYFIKELVDKPIEINYKDEMLLNFIKINKSINNSEAYKKSNKIIWGPYTLNIQENEIIMKQIDELLNL